MNYQITDKRKTVGNGIFKAELSKIFMSEFAEDGYYDVEIRRTPNRLEAIIVASHTENVLRENGRRIRELSLLVQKRFCTNKLYVDKIALRGLCAVAQCESIRYKIIGGLAISRVCFGVLRFIMESHAAGCEICISGKLRGQRAKSLKFADGIMVHSGHPKTVYVQEGVRHIALRQGVLGIKVRIMLPYDYRGNIGPRNPLPDVVFINEPEDEVLPPAPYSEPGSSAKTSPFDDF